MEVIPMPDPDEIVHSLGKAILTIGVAVPVFILSSTPKAKPATAFACLALNLVLGKLPVPALAAYAALTTALVLMTFVVLDILSWCVIRCTDYRFKRTTRPRS
jgi:hypothetical protein